MKNNLGYLLKGKNSFLARNLEYDKYIRQINKPRRFLKQTNLEKQKRLKL